VSLEAEEVLAMPSEFFRVALECRGRDDPTTGQVATVRLATHAADSSIGSTIDGSSFSGLTSILRSRLGGMTQPEFNVLGAFHGRLVLWFGRCRRFRLET
jgi:hypothetical protein